MRLDLSDTKSDFLQREIETMPVQQIKENQLKKVQAVALAEPLLLNRLITKKTDLTGVNVTINLPHK